MVPPGNHEVSGLGLRPWTLGPSLTLIDVYLSYRFAGDCVTVLQPLTYACVWVYCALRLRSWCMLSCACPRAHTALCTCAVPVLISCHVVLT